MSFKCVADESGHESSGASGHYTAPGGLGSRSNGLTANGTHSNDAGIAEKLAQCSQPNGLGVITEQ